MNFDLDVELLKKYLLMFKIPLAIVVVAILVSVGLLCKIVPDTITLLGNQKTLKEKEIQLNTKQNELDSAKRQKENAANLDTGGLELKTFYRDIKNTGNSTSDILAGEIQEINDLIKYYDIKLYKVNYNYDIEDDAFYKAKKDQYSVCQMQLELFGSYMRFQSFLKDLYKHEHFLDIQSIEINPYKKDKSILSIKMDLSLYAEKGENTGGSTEIPTDNPVKNGSGEDLNIDLDLQ